MWDETSAEIANLYRRWAQSRPTAPPRRTNGSPWQSPKTLPSSNSSRLSPRPSGIRTAPTDFAPRSTLPPTWHRVHRLGAEGPRVLPQLASQVPDGVAIDGRFVISLNERTLALSHPHGRSLSWL